MKYNCITESDMSRGGQQRTILETMGGELPILYCATDGACSDNGSKRAKGGYSAIFDGDVHEHLSIAEPMLGQCVTNNRCETMGLIRALEQAPNGLLLHVYSDSMLLVNTVNKWMSTWKRNGWRKADGKPVMNVDLLQHLDRLLLQRHVVLEHVRAHTNKKDRASLLNERADFWAKQACVKGIIQIPNRNVHAFNT